MLPVLQLLGIQNPDTQPIQAPEQIQIKNPLLDSIFKTKDVSEQAVGAMSVVEQIQAAKSTAQAVTPISPQITAAVAPTMPTPPTAFVAPVAEPKSLMAQLFPTQGHASQELAQAEEEEVPTASPVISLFGGQLSI